MPEMGDYHFVTEWDVAAMSYKELKKFAKDIHLKERSKMNEMKLRFVLLDLVKNGRIEFEKKRRINEIKPSQF